MTDKKFYIHSDNIEVKSASSSKKSFKIAGYANTSTKDRTGDIVLPEAWLKGVENYRKNPVLLYQHDHSKPIGKAESVRVDKKGIFVEGSVSDAAEKLHGVQTLIQDGALKSFSVGFRVKDADYDRTEDTFFIKELELLEISVVSVPANQESLFSIRKSFDDDLYSLSEDQVEKLPTVCGSLREAMQSLDKDRKFLTEGGVFTDDQIDAYIELKFQEIYKFEHTPHPIEFEMYYSD